MIRKEEIEENFRKARQTSQTKNRRRYMNRKPKILTGLAIDFKGKLMKRMKVDVETLPTEEAKHASVRVHGMKRVKSRNINREEYEQLLSKQGIFLFFNHYFSQKSSDWNKWFNGFSW